MKLSRLLPCLFFAFCLLSHSLASAQQLSGLALKTNYPDSLLKVTPQGSSLADSIPSLKKENIDLIAVQVVDSTQVALNKPIVSKPLSAKAILIPSAMIAYGAFALSNKELKNLNLALRKEVWEERNNGAGKPLHIDNFTIVAPAVAVYALNIAGVKGKNNLVDRSLIYGMSNLISSGVVSSVKRFSDVVRPDSSNLLSFPSGHTAKAFVAAEFLRQEYKHLSPWYGVAGYAVAAGTGFLRMYNNKHWFNDVIAGAGVGILSTRLSYWLYPKLKNVFTKEGKEKKSNTVIMPTYQDGAVGFGMVHSF